MQFAFALVQIGFTRLQFRFTRVQFAFALVQIGFTRVQFRFTRVQTFAKIAKTPVFNIAKA